MANYKHTKKIHNRLAPSVIVPKVIELIRPSSIIDVGCGIGTFLREFQESGVNDSFGIDGAWCDLKLLQENISLANYIEKDLEKSLKMNRQFDLAVSLEVAEHLSYERAKSFVSDLCALSNVVLFSAAVPYQGGSHHLNEQPLRYWTELFEKEDYQLFDVLRPIFWDDNSIDWWYRQNIVLYVKNGFDKPSFSNLKSFHGCDLIHPVCFELFANPKADNGFKRHLKMLLRSLF